MTALRVTALDHVQIAAPRDCDEAIRAFYGGLLGLKEREKPEPLRSRGGVWFDCGNMELHVGVDQTPPVNMPSKRHVALSVSNLPLARDSLIEAGCEIEEDRAPIEGVRRFYVRDPAGNRVEILQRA